MRIFWSIVLLSQILLITCREGTFYLVFKINQDYIAENLCEKRFEPKSCCEGSCTLRKVIVESHEEPDPKDNQAVPSIDEERVYYLEPIFSSLNRKKQEANPNPDRDKNWHLVSYSPSLFKPPRA